MTIVRHRLLCCLLGLVVIATLPAVVQAAGQVVELRLYNQGDRLRLDLRARDLLDERTSLTIDSGLPGTCVFHLLLEDHRHNAVAEHFVEMSLRLDLWENRYLLAGHGGDRDFATLAAADSAWSDLRAVDLCPFDHLDESLEYRVVVQIFVQPLAAEDRERMSSYVRRHSGSSREELSLDLTALFAGIFGRKARNEQLARHSGPLFRPVDVEVRP